MLSHTHTHTIENRFLVLCTTMCKKNLKNLFMIAMVLVCTLENIIGVKGAERCEANIGKKKIINSIFTHADKCTDEKSRRVKCCV